MLTEKAVRALVALRVDEMTRAEALLPGVDAERHAFHVEGQVRALVAVLTGRRPPVCADPAGYLSEAGIPIVVHPDGSWQFDDDWLAAHRIVAARGPTVAREFLFHPDLGAW